MYDSVDRSAVRALRKRKHTYQQIAQELGMDRRTVKTLLEVPTDRTYSRDRAPAMADSFQEEIVRWDDDGVPIQRMLELAREDKVNPYDGSRSAFFARAKLFLAEHRKSKADRFVRFEGLPGEYCQVDWGELRNFPFLRLKGETRYFLAMRLKFSRKSYVEFTRDMKLETLIRCMLRGYESFPGVSWVGVFDNMKTVTSGRDAAGLPIWNPTFFRFSQDIDFHPEACAPASGNQKGSVENLVGWVKSNFLKGRTFIDDDGVCSRNGKNRTLSPQTRTATVRLGYAWKASPAGVARRPGTFLIPSTGNGDTHDCPSRPERQSAWNKPRAGQSASLEPSLTLINSLTKG